MPKHSNLTGEASFDNMAPPTRTSIKGRQLCKFFAGHGLFVGKIRHVWVSNNNTMVFVKYSDGDSEDIPLSIALGMPEKPRQHHPRKQRHPRCSGV